MATIEIAREMAHAPAFGHLLKPEAMPGSLSATEMETYLRDSAVTFWHQASTAKMGHDPMSVVNGRLQVHGVDRLRIADASIMPNVPTGNTMAPCMVIAERPAEIIKQAHGIWRDAWYRPGAQCIERKLEFARDIMPLGRLASACVEVTPMKRGGSAPSLSKPGEVASNTRLGDYRPLF